MTLWQDISNHITTSTGHTFDCRQQQASSGGCINETYKISDGHAAYFVKLNHVNTGDMYIAEAEGLREIAASNTIKVPEVICHGDSGNQAYLVLEQLEFGHGSDSHHERFGQTLARMHRHTATQYGWRRDNTIGATPQSNQQTDIWITFWRDQRLAFQLDLAARNGFAGRLQSLGEQLLAIVDEFFSGYSPEPALLHGDLWSGNYAFCKDGTPVIFDPAVYYGDRETDLAMTELFGGFSSRFYQSYQADYPLDSGYPQRKTLYNLYHILNHLNLFGGGYLSQSESMLERLLAELR